jgi:rRNA maturation RNase YbeY
MDPDLGISVTIACDYTPTFSIEDFIRRILPLKDVSCGSFEFSFVDGDTIREINKTHLNHDYVTDIITFNLGTPEAIEGDIYICIEKAKENADTFGQTLDEEVQLLLIHGILHLLDYHDYTDEEKHVMDQEQHRLLELVKHG